MTDRFGFSSYYTRWNWAIGGIVVLLLGVFCQEADMYRQYHGADPYIATHIMLLGFSTLGILFGVVYQHRSVRKRLSEVPPLDPRVLAVIARTFYATLIFAFLTLEISLD